MMRTVRPLVLGCLLATGCTAIAPFGDLSTGDGDAGSDAGDPASDAGDPTPDAGDGMRIVFLSSDTYNGSLSGVDGADARCSALAARQGLGTEFIAWISDAETSPAARFDRTVGPYVRVDGALVAEDWDDLTDGILVNLVDLDENNQVISDGGASWTGTDFAGDPTSDGATCEGWTAATFEARGAIGAYDDDEFGAWSHWNDAGAFPCENRFHLYCFQR